MKKKSSTTVITPKPVDTRSARTQALEIIGYTENYTLARLNDRIDRVIDGAERMVRDLLEHKERANSMSAHYKLENVPEAMIHTVNWCLANFDLDGLARAGVDYATTIEPVKQAKAMIEWCATASDEQIEGAIKLAEIMDPHSPARYAMQEFLHTRQTESKLLTQALEEVADQMAQ